MVCSMNFAFIRFFCICQLTDLCASILVSVQKECKCSIKHCKFRFFKHYIDNYDRRTYLFLLNTISYFCFIFFNK